MKKLLLGLSIAAISCVSIQANPIAQNSTIFGAPNGVRSPISGTLSAYVQDGVLPYQFNIEGQAFNGTVMLSPTDGSYTFNPTNFPASFQYSVTDTSGNKSNSATITIVPGPMISATNEVESDLG
jgi:hypothetical protein